MRRGAIYQLAAFAVIAAAICVAVALLVPWLPVAAGVQAQRIDMVFWVTTGIAIFVFSIVAAVIVYSVWKFRAQPDDDSDGPPIHGHTTLEIAWTAVPAVLVTVIAVISAIVLARNGNAGPDPVKILVTGRQFEWSFTYSNGKTLGYLEIPEHRATELDITAVDVIHGFWVPQLSQKQDAVPGEHNKIVVTPTRLGTFPVVCTELCGLGHSLMRSHVNIVTQAQFASFMKSGGTTTASPGLAVFQQNGCSSCHTFKPAGATGKIGPDLDKLKEYAAQAHQGPLTAFIKESIVNPSAYIQPGFQNLMPKNFAQTIPAPKLAQLVQYLAENAH